jgi:hypothetical protein
MSNQFVMNRAARIGFAIGDRLDRMIRGFISFTGSKTLERWYAALDRKLFGLAYSICLFQIRIRAKIRRLNENNN